MTPWRLVRNGHHWTAQRTDENGRRRRKGLGRRDEVSQLAARRQIARLNDALATGIDDLEGPALEDAWRGFIAERAGDWSPKRRRMYENTRDRMIAKFWGGRRVGRITRADLGEWKAQMLAEGLRPATVGSYIDQAKAFYAWCADCEHIHRNPCRRLTVAQEPTEYRVPTDAEVRSLLAATTDRPPLRMLVALCALAGLRRGEALALRWGDIHDDRIVVRQTKTAKATGRARRTVRLEPELAAMFPPFDPPASSQVVVLQGDTALRLVRRAMRQADVSWPKPFQSLRRWRATTWRRGYPEHVVDAWMGHGREVARRHYVEVEASYYG